MPKRGRKHVNGKERRAAAKNSEADRRNDSTFAGRSVGAVVSSALALSDSELDAESE